MSLELWASCVGTSAHCTDRCTRCAALYDYLDGGVSALAPGSARMWRHMVNGKVSVWKRSIIQTLSTWQRRRQQQVSGICCAGVYPLRPGSRIINTCRIRFCSTHTVEVQPSKSAEQHFRGEDSEGRQYDSLRKCGNAKVC
jgi:hypothetical protein